MSKINMEKFREWKEKNKEHMTNLVADITKFGKSDDSERLLYMLLLNAYSSGYCDALDSQLKVEE